MHVMGCGNIGRILQGTHTGATRNDGGPGEGRPPSLVFNVRACVHRGVLWSGTHFTGTLNVPRRRVMGCNQVRIGYGKLTYCGRAGVMGCFG
jgi:hypothetical protein